LPMACEIDPSAIIGGDTLEGALHYAATFDGLGRSIREENDFCTIERQFTSLDCINSETTIVRNLPGAPGPVSRTLSREFNRSGAVTALGFPSGRGIAFDRDGLDRLVAIRQLDKDDSYPGDPTTPDAYLIAQVN